MNATSMSESNESLPPLVREMLSVFTGEMRDVRFGEIDASRLAEVADRVIAVEAKVEEAREHLDAAKRVHEHELCALNALASKALAYARIHAEGDEELSERLARLVTPDAAPKKRKRRKKTPPTAAEVTELPFEKERTPQVAAN